MAIKRVINYVVGVDGQVTCNGSRRPQNAGVQGEKDACKLIFDMSAVFTGKEHYFFEFVCGCGTPIILSDESDGVEFDSETKMLSVVLGLEITSEGGRAEVRIIEEVLDDTSNSAVEGETYVTYIKFESKSGVIMRFKETAYGILLECRQLLKTALSSADTAKSAYDEAVETHGTVTQLAEAAEASAESAATSENNAKNSANKAAVSASSASQSALNAAESEEKAKEFANSSASVKYNEFQNLNESQKETARNNIFAKSYFEIDEDSALEVETPSNGAPPLMKIKNGGEVSSDNNGLYLNKGYGLRNETYNPCVVVVDTDVIATVEELNKKENKLVAGFAINILEVENGEKRTVVSVDGNQVVVKGEFNAAVANLESQNASLFDLLIKNNAQGRPISLSDHSTLPLRNMRFYGKSTQDGTPTTDEPIDIVSTSFKTVKVYGGNIFDISKFPTNVSSTCGVEVNGDEITFTAKTSGAYRQVGYEIRDVNLFKDKIYIGYNVVDNPKNLNQNLIFRCYDKSNNQLTNKTIYKGTNTISVPKETVKINIIFCMNMSETAAVGDTVTISNFRISNYYCDYEPYKLPTIVTLSNSVILRGLPVSAGGNITIDDQQYLSDYIDIGSGKVVRNVGVVDSYNGEEITTDYLSTMGELSEGATVIYALQNSIEEDLTQADVEKLQAIQPYNPNSIITSNAEMAIDYIADTKKYIDKQYSKLATAITALGGTI